MSSYPIFSVIGIEIEYMLVNKDTFNIEPKSDVILHQLAGKTENEVSLGPIAVSNELVMHVLELKNNGPKPLDAPLAQQFQDAIEKMIPILGDHNLQFLPTGAHPWMNPLVETVRWPYGNKAIYNQYDKIFDCRGHGWSNLQSMHVNLPFSNDKEFCMLHNAIRLILPLLPALCASTPILEGKATGLLDSRLDFYEKNQAKIPSISGQIIPDFIASKAFYHRDILEPMFRDIEAYDPEKILQHEWLNSRGAIAKFDYNAIEIRILDSQEYVNADIAIAKLIHALLKHFTKESYYLSEIIATDQLKTIYDKTISQGLNTRVDDSFVLRQWTLPGQPATLLEVWTALIEKVSASLDMASQQALEHILKYGNLSSRILKSFREDPNHGQLLRIYKTLADCLIHNEPFHPL